MKELTIPKLEFQETKMIADLANRICADFVISLDSITVFCWLSKSSESWEVFVKNKVDKIIDIIPFENWRRYVKSYANPADIATRRLSAGEFRENLQI